ncbi:MAG: nickel-dependent hydrogenase large subunit, partial [Rhodospirillaceae bacterium]|nr:nickel-dependent hydrogenase large subunit [Rhodospirillaceae bacterium]
RVHMALIDAAGSIGVATIRCRDGRFPSVGRAHAPALRLERAVRDLWGLEPEGCPDGRPWLDHGRWPVHAPLGVRRPAEGAPGPYRFLEAEGEGLHQIPVGPVHAGIIEPGHFRFHVGGETVVRLEALLGFVHKGTESLMAGATVEHAAKLAGRVSGDSTVAYAVAFARAVEAAVGIEAPARAQVLRGVMAELERVANHLGDFGAICNDAAFVLLHNHAGVLRELTLRAAGRCFGHRLMMDCVVPGGAAVDVGPAEVKALRLLVAELRRRFPALVELYDNTASLQDRTVKAGIVAPALAARFGAGGYVGRAAGRAFAARRTPGYPPYGELGFTVPVRQEGDVDARVWIRIREIEQSLAMIERLLDRVPDGPARVEVDGRGGGEGMALVEGFRGDVLVWVRLGVDGRVERCYPRDPSWFQWPLLEAAIEGNIVADFPLCNKSFNCSYSGHDL